MKEIPLYVGPSLQTAKANPGTAARAANGDQVQMLGASVQKAEEAVQGSAEAFARISDFGEMQRQEVELRRIRDESDAKFSKMLAYAPGTDGSVFEKDGSIRQGKLDDLAYEFGQKIEGLGGSFFHPENALKAGATRDSVKASLPERYWGLAAKHQLGVARQTFETSLKLAEEKGDWGGYESSVMGAVESGAISPNEGELRLLRGKKKETLQDFGNLSATNPDLAAEKINRGELDGLFSAAEQDEMMRSLRRQDDSRLTELIEQMASKPKSQSTKQNAVDVMMSGPMYTDEVGFLDVLSRDGNFEACSPQIDSFIYRVADMVQAGEEGAAFASKKEDVIRLCKKYGKSSEFKQDVLNRMDKLAKRKEEYPMLKVSERMKEMEGAPLFRQADYNNAIGTLDAEAKSAYQLYADSAKGSDMPKDSEDTWTKKYKKEKIENLQKNLAAKTEIAVRERFEAWYEGEKQGSGKEPSYVLQEDMLQTILRETTGRNDLVVPSRGRLLNEYQQNVSEKWRDWNKERFSAGPKKLAEAEKQALQQKEVLRKPVTFPATVSVDTVNTNAPAGILLPESMRGRFGDDLSGLAALVPSSSSSRRGKPLPVVGYTKESSPQLTLSGASKLRMTFSSKMDVNVTISPASPEMKEFFKREYLGYGDGAPPDDYGLLPAETATPVSSVYTNDAGTTNSLLPPLQ